MPLVSKQQAVQFCQCFLQFLCLVMLPLVFSHCDLHFCFFSLYSDKIIPFPEALKLDIPTTIVTKIVLKRYSTVLKSYLKLVFHVYFTLFLVKFVTLGPFISASMSL